jgi:hypothetical protein
MIKVKGSLNVNDYGDKQLVPYLYSEQRVAPWQKLPTNLD